MPHRLVLTLVPPAALDRVRAASPRRALVRATNLAQMATDLREVVGGVVVVDSANWHVDALGRLAGKVASHGARLVVYSELSPCLALELSTIGDHTVPEVIARGVDDSIPHLRAALARQLASAPAELLHCIRTAMARLDSRLAPQTLAMFSSGRLPSAVGDLASDSKVTEKTIIQWYANAGLATTERLTRGARVIRAFDLIASGADIATACNAVGLSDPRRLRDGFSDFLGIPPNRATKDLTPAEAAIMLAKRLLR